MSPRDHGGPGASRLLLPPPHDKELANQSAKHDPPPAGAGGSEPKGPSSLGRGFFVSRDQNRGRAQRQPHLRSGRNRADGAGSQLRQHRDVAEVDTDTAGSAEKYRRYNPPRHPPPPHSPLETPQ